MSSDPGAETLDAPVKQVRYFGSSDLEADVQTLMGHLAAAGRWRSSSVTAKNCWGWTSIR